MNLTAYTPALLYALAAGIATGIGGFLVLLYRKTNARLLSTLLGFSAGVMIYVSFIEIFPEAEAILMECRGNTNGRILTVLSFFFGIVLIALIDEIVPEPNNPHESHRLEEANANSNSVRNHSYLSRINPDPRKAGRLLKTGIFTAVAVTIHNFPEGIAAFISGVRNPVLGISIALAIAIHNIPEGIAIAIPVYYATRSRKRAFLMSFLSGLSEPLGAVLAMLILGPFISDTLFGIVFAAVSGIMVYISLDELLPTAREYGEHHFSMLGLVMGMGVMALSVLIIF